MKKKIILATVTCLLTLLGNYWLTYFVQEKAKPVLVKDIYLTDLSGLPPELQKQIPLVPIKYSLQHKSGAVAQNLTVLIKSDLLLSISDLKFSVESEDHQFGMVDSQTFKINIPAIRPNGQVSFQIIVPASSKITFTELAQNAQIVFAKDLESQKQKNSIYETCMIVAAILLWVAFIVWVSFLVWRIGKWWRDKEGAATPDEVKNKVVYLIAILFIYQVATGSLGPFSGFLPVPHIPFSDIISAFILYFLVTRHKLIETWLSTKKSVDSTPENKGANSTVQKADK